MRYEFLPRIQSSSADVSDVVPRRRLMGDDADPWLTFGIAGPSDELWLASELPIERIAVAQLIARSGGWIACPTDEDASLIGLYNADVGGTLLSWEGDPFYAVEPIWIRERCAEPPCSSRQTCSRS